MTTCQVVRGRHAWWQNYESSSIPLSTFPPGTAIGIGPWWLWCRSPSMIYYINRSCLHHDFPVGCAQWGGVGCVRSGSLRRGSEDWNGWPWVDLLCCWGVRASDFFFCWVGYLCIRKTSKRGSVAGRSHSTWTPSGVLQLKARETCVGAPWEVFGPRVNSTPMAKSSTPAGAAWWDGGIHLAGVLGRWFIPHRLPG